MARESQHPVLHYLRKIVGPPAPADRTDRHLLTEFALHHDQAAFGSLVHRHAALVWGIAMRMLGHVHDAEDVFQATFLVLARKAARVAWRDDIGNWLHAVAVRTALKARSEAARRHRKERQMKDRAIPAGEPGGEEIRLVLDEELTRLPEKYRAPVVLHYLEGKTYAEAAKALGWPEGTVSVRLSRARTLLRARLARRGLAPSAAVLAAELSRSVAPAAAPAALLESSIKAAVLTADNPTAAAGVVSVRVAVLMEGVLKTMFLNKLKMIAGLALVVCLIGTGLGLLAREMWAAEPADLPPAARPASENAREKQLRKEVDRLNRQLIEMKEKLAALEKRLDGDEDGNQPALYKGKPARFWIRALKDRAPAYRKEAVQALGAIAEVEPQVIPTLIRSLKDRDWEVRETAVAALGDIGPAAGAGVPRLIQIMKESPNGREQSAVVSALVAIGPAALPALAELLKDPSNKVRLLAVQALPAGGPAAVPVLVKALQDRDREVRGQAVASLGGMGSKARPALPALLRAWQSDRSIRTQVIVTLGAIHADAETVVPVLARALFDENLDIRSRVAWALGQFGPQARAAVPALVRVFQSKPRHLIGEEKAFAAVAGALRRIDVVAAAKADVPFTDAKYIPALTRALRSHDKGTRIAVTYALSSIGHRGSYANGNIGSEVEPVIPALINALGDADRVVRVTAANGLGAMGRAPTAAVPALIEALSDKASEVRAAAAGALEQLQQEARKAVPALVKALRDENPTVRRAAAKALQSIDPQRKNAEAPSDP